MIYLKTEEQLKYLVKAGNILSECLSFLSLQVKPGVTGLQIDKMAEDFVRSYEGASCACKGYQGYPANICISLNAFAVHGIPDNKLFCEGDIVKLDLVIDYLGFKCDSAVTILIPPVKPEVQRLATIGVEALKMGILAAKEGSRVSDITQAVFNTVNGTGFSLCKEFVGHGIGTSIHEAPQVPCIPANKPSPLLVSGMVLAIEPIVIASTNNAVYYKSGSWPTWSLVGANVVHNEHSVLITEKEPKILTLRKEEKFNAF